MWSNINGFLLTLRKVASEPALVQGGGGNFSVKDGAKMLIKASGYRFSEITGKFGLVTLDYKNLCLSFSRISSRRVSPQAEAESEKQVTANIISRIGPETLRPSIETGFHAFLGKYVLHTHSVYANIITCAKGGQKLCKQLFGSEVAWVPFATPGLALTLSIRRISAEYLRRHKRDPAVLFVQNHGLIVSADDINRLFELHAWVNNKIKIYFKLSAYPVVKIVAAPGGFKSQTSFLKSFLRQQPERVKKLTQTILFPDQAVFCNQIGFTGKKPPVAAKIFIDFTRAQIDYASPYKTALTVEEELTAWAYIVWGIQKAGLKLNTIAAPKIKYIQNMETEKHRQKLLSV